MPMAILWRGRRTLWAIWKNLGGAPILSQSDDCYLRLMSSIHLALERRGTFDSNVGPEQWLEYLDKTGLESTVLYTTAALAYGHVVNPEWA
jgi:hypothetical protein